MDDKAEYPLMRRSNRRAESEDNCEHRVSSLPSTKIWRWIVGLLITFVIFPIGGWVLKRTVNADERFASKPELTIVLAKIENGFEKVDKDYVKKEGIAMVISQIQDGFKETQTLQRQALADIAALSTKQAVLNAELTHVKIEVEKNETAAGIRDKSIRERLRDAGF